MNPIGGFDDNCLMFVLQRGESLGGRTANGLPGWFRGAVAAERTGCERQNRELLATTFDLMLAEILGAHEDGRAQAPQQIG